MNYQNILFDLYGTLADIHTDESKKELWKSLSVWYQSHGAAYTPWKLQKDYMQYVAEEKKEAAVRHPEYHTLDIRIETVFERLYTSQDICVSQDTIAETALYFRTLSRKRLRLYPGVRSMLAKLRAEGRHCYLLTNAQSLFTVPELRLLGISDCFDGCMISSEQECAKPDPHFFQAAFQQFQLDRQQTVMVGNDLLTDIAGADASGIASVYIHSNLSPQRTGAPGNTYVIADGSIEKLSRLLSGLS